MLDTEKIKFMPQYLFDEFNPISQAEWIKKIEQDLKGKPISVLESEPEPGLLIKAYHHRESRSSESSNTIIRNRPNNDWSIREIFDSNDSNQKILDHLNNGINHVGIIWSNQNDFDRLTKDVLFEHIGSDIQFNSIDEAKAAKVTEHSILVFDPISKFAKDPSFKVDFSDYLDFHRTFRNHKSIWISGHTYGNAGANTIQELAFTIAHLNEYLISLTEAGEPLDSILPKITIELSVSENYLINIGKFRVIHNLFSLLLEGYEYKLDNSELNILARTTDRYLALNDAHNNPLRQTTQAMSAVIGGCYALTISNRKTGNKTIDNRFERLARNIQLILKEESYLNKVVDPAAGSYFIEQLCAQLVEKSWALFLEIEDQGGLIKAINKGSIQTLIQTNREVLINEMNAGKKTFLGVNKHPNGMEDWKTPIKDTNESGLSVFHLENYLNQKGNE